MSRACAISASGIIAGLPPAQALQQCLMPTLMQGGCEYHRQPNDHYCHDQPDHHLCDYIIAGPQGCLILTHCSAQCVLCKVYFSVQLNKLRPILKFNKYYPIEHIFVPACSSARKIHFFKLY